MCSLKMPRWKLFVYFWIGLTVAIVVIPCIYLLYVAWKKSSKFIDEKAQIIKENKELKHIKSDLEEQKEELIVRNEYWTFVPQDDSVVWEEKKEEKGEWEAEESSVLKVEQDSDEKLHEIIEDVEKKEQAQEKEKKKFDALLLEAELLKNEGKFEQYEKKLIEAMVIDDESLKVLKPLSDLYFPLGNYKKALSLLKKVSELDPTDHKVIWQIAEIYFVAWDTQTTELLIEKAINLKNDNTKYYLTMVEIYYNTERYDEALAYMEKIIKLRPTNPKYLLATAELYEQIGDIDNAKKYYFTVLEYEQNNEKAKAKIKKIEPRSGSIFLHKLSKRIIL